MKSKIFTFLTLFLLGGVYSFAIVPGKGAPINTNQIVLIIAGLLLIVGVIAYKKLSTKKVV